MPQRTCLGCRAKRPTDEMVRICLVQGGRLAASASSTGRGVWICRNKACFEAAKVRGKVERALKTKLVADVQKQLSSISEVLGF